MCPSGVCEGVQLGICDDECTIDDDCQSGWCVGSPGQCADLNDLVEIDCACSQASDCQTGYCPDSITCQPISDCSLACTDPKWVDLGRQIFRQSISLLFRPSSDGQLPFERKLGVSWP